VCISLDAFNFVLTGFANEYRPVLQSSLQQLVVQCTALLHLLLPQEDKGNPPRYVALCRKLKLTQKVSVQVQYSSYINCSTVGPLAISRSLMCRCATEGSEAACTVPLQERVALNYIFLQNTGVLFAKVLSDSTSCCYGNSSSTSPPPQLHHRFSPLSHPSSFSGSRISSMALAAAAFAEMNGREMRTYY